MQFCSRYPERSNHGRIFGGINLFVSVYVGVHWPYIRRSERKAEVHNFTQIHIEYRNPKMLIVKSPLRLPLVGTDLPFFTAIMALRIL